MGKQLNDCILASRSCAYGMGVLLLVWFLIGSCQLKHDKVNTATMPTTNMETIGVTVAKVIKTQFRRELLCNGICKAAQKADVGFGKQGIIARIYVKNGNAVSKGQILAKLDDAKERQQLEAVQILLAKARLEFADQLISMGHTPNDSANIPKQKLETALIRSGYYDAKHQLKMAMYDLQQTEVLAPFDGIIGGLEAMPDNPTNSFKRLCYVISSGSFEVHFKLMESEASGPIVGQKVEISSFTGVQRRVLGAITQLDPMVDENGMLKAIARIEEGSEFIMDGMSVELTLIKEINDQLVIPKSALLTRQGRTVVFNVENGLALWNYVRVGEENSAYVTITEGLKEGMVVITGNNLTIGHNAPVKILDNQN